jgi:hypothetical protein
MDPRVSEFSSVLEIAFSVSFIFFIFEISPWMKKKSTELQNEFSEISPDIDRTKADGKYIILALILKANLEGIRFLEKYLLAYTVLSGATSLGLLITIGFKPDLLFPVPVIIIILVVLFGMLPYYLLQHYVFCSLQRFCTKRMRKRLGLSLSSESDFKGESKAEPVSIVNDGAAPHRD